MYHEGIDLIGPTDLRVVFDSKSNSDEHIHEKLNRETRTLGIIKYNFRLLSGRSFISFYEAMIGPHLRLAMSSHQQRYI